MQEGAHAADAVDDHWCALVRVPRPRHVAAGGERHGHSGGRTGQRTGGGRAGHALHVHLLVTISTCKQTNGMYCHYVYNYIYILIIMECLEWIELGMKRCVGELE